MKIKNFILKPWVLIIISAVFSALPFTFANLFLVSWVSFVPLFYVIINHSGDKLRKLIGRGFLFGFVYHACVYYWFLWFFPFDYINLSDGVSIAIVLLAWFGISAAHGVLWCVPFMLCHFVQKIKKSPALLCFAAVVGIITVEKLTSISELSFPWTRISLGQYKATALIQSASLFGIDGVDMLILCVNALITICIVSPPKMRTVTAISAACVFVANLLFGVIRIHTAPAGSEMTIMTVQGSISREDKWSLQGEAICYGAYSSLTKENLSPEVQLVLWPESAVPTMYNNDEAATIYSRLSDEIDTPIMVGVLQYKYGQSTNDVLFVDHRGERACYSKRQLVPFGEYMPYQSVLSTVFPFLDALNLMIDDYTAGSSSTIMTTDYGKVGNIICFESIYPHLSRQSTLDGAEVLFEITNDSWLDDSPAIKQHLAHGVFRSVENGRYMVRSANSGVSAVIDSRGRVLSRLDVNTQGVITDKIYLYNSKTLYTLVGNILYPICIGVLFALCVALIIKNKKSAEN